MADQLVMSMSGGGGAIAATFQECHIARMGVLDEAIEAARLTIPSVQPPHDWTEEEPLPTNFQSLGARGMVYIVGKVLLGVFAPDRLWAQEDLPPEVRYDPNVDPVAMQAAEQRLFLRSLQIIATLESANFNNSRGDFLGFRTINRQALTQIFVTGDCLQRMDAKFRLTNFRRDRYVTKRNADGAVCYHVTVEGKDLLELTDVQLEKCGVKLEDIQNKRPHQRLKPMYTMVQWQPRSETWLIEQEILGKKINDSEEPISNHFSVPFDLAIGANYGRGLPALMNGDLRSFDKMSEHTLNFAAASSKHHPILSPGSRLNPEDFEVPAGTVLIDDVEGGQPRNIAWLQAQRLNDFNVVHMAKSELRADIGKSLQMPSESVRESERTTLGEVEQVTLAELQGGLGGFYSPVADGWQGPMFARAKYQLEEKGKILTLPPEVARVRVLAGIEALARMAQAGKLMRFAEVVLKLDPEGEYLKRDVLFDVLARMEGINEPGMIRSAKEREEIRQRNIAAQAQVEANSQAIKTTGAIVEQQATGATANGRGNGS